MKLEDVMTEEDQTTLNDYLNQFSNKVYDLMRREVEPWDDMIPMSAIVLAQAFILEEASKTNMAFMDKMQSDFEKEES